MSDFKTKYGPWAMIAGASEGLGEAFANSLAKKGLHLVLIARRAEKLETLANKLKEQYKIEVKCLALDLADYKTVKAAIENLPLEIGLLIYNAAFAPIGYFKDVSEQDLSGVVSVNINTPLLLSKLISSGMIARKRGGIVLMSSLAGQQGSPKIATYAASKAFNSVLAEGIWSELHQHNVDVISACAGAIRTPGYKNAQNTKDAPGTLDAAEVAESTLNSLGKGPTIVPGITNKIAHFFMSRLIPKKMAISIMNKNTKHLN